MTASDAWAALDEPWRHAFDLAWTSWRAGSYGIGAVLVDPSDATIVATGRNRVGEYHDVPGRLSGNMTAHAEMNAFAAMTSFNAEGLHLVTTLEPCLMCLGTATLLRVADIRFAADDEFFDGLVDTWRAHPVTAARLPDIAPATLDPDGRLAAFARLLPMSFTLRVFPDRNSAALARREHPGLAAMADGLDRFDGDHPDDPATALSAWWDDLGRAISRGRS